MFLSTLTCPFCHSEDVIKTGAINFFCEAWFVCKDCGRDFIPEPPKTQEKKEDPRVE